MSKIIKICLWVLAFIPLVVDGTVFFPYGEGKVVLMRGILVLINILFLFNFFHNKQFKQRTVEKIKLYIKNPLVISISIFVFLSIISTIFATDKYIAFWGNIERAEGLVSIIYLLSFFIFSLLIFEKKDWLWFFKLSLFVSLALLLKEFFEFFTIGVIHAFVGNATFLAGYLLFSILCSFVVYSERARNEFHSGGIKNKFWKYFSICIAILSLFGIIIAANRGTIVGLAIGFIAVLIYGILKGKDISYKKFNFRSISIILLCSFIIFSGVFIATRKSLIWQKVPGISRIAVIGSEDYTTQTRLIMAKISLQAVNPVQNGVKKFLIGWGPENFNLAYDKYFNPGQFEYEVGWFDRAHNKFFDVLVMNGLLGLLAYLSIYFFFFRFVFIKKEFSLSNIGLLYFGVSIFVYLFFAFDQLAIFIPLFATLAYLVYLTHDNDIEHEINNIKNTFITIFLLVLTLFLSFVYFRNDLPGYIQMRYYLSLYDKHDPAIILDKINPVFSPFTSAQADIRDDFLSFVSKNYNGNDESIVKLLNLAILQAEDYTKKRHLDFNFSINLAFIYTTLGKNLNNLPLLQKGEEYFNKILLFSPNKLDSNYGLALNWLYQGKFNESFNLFEKVFDTIPKYFLQKDKGPEVVYSVFLHYFYQTRDKENFIKTAERLQENNYAGSAMLNQIVAYIKKTNKWPFIDFK